MQAARRLDAINPQLVCWLFAIVAWTFGFVLYVTGATPLPLLGTLMIADGCFAAGLAVIRDARSQARAVRWFVGGHFLAATGFFLLRNSVPGISENVVTAMMVIAVVFTYLWTTVNGDQPYRVSDLTVLFGRSARKEGDIRSNYEEQIRKAAAQEERNRLARDLHDAVKQQIFAIQTSAATAQTRFESDPFGTREAIDRIRDSAREAMTELEAMLDQLRATPLENVGLAEALKKVCAALDHRTGAEVDLEIGELPASTLMVPGSQEALLRVAQEAFANIARHARANTVKVCLQQVAGRIELTVRDDGAGFDTNEATNGMGLANMRARAEEFGGELEITSRPGTGTEIRFSIPYVIADPQEHRRRILFLSVLLLMQFGFLLDNGNPFLVAMVAGIPIAIVREVIAYRRAKALI